MAKVQITFDHTAWAEVLKGQDVADMVAEFASTVADNVRASLPAGTDVVVDRYVTDRAAASVTIRDAMGKLWQVRDGVLTRAAAAAGVEVKARAT